jgi:hypothetical protein
MKLRALVATMCAVLLVAPAAFAETTSTMSISGDVETNSTFEISTTEKGAGNDDLTQTGMTHDGRTHITFDGRTESDSGWFGAAKGDAMIATSGTTGVDDAWVQFGTSSFSMLVGRVEMESAFSKGQDTYIAEAPNMPGRYQGDFFRGRVGGGAGHVQMDFNLGEASAFQLGIMLGGADQGTTYVSTSTDPNTGAVVTEVLSTDIGVNVWGARPQFKYSSGSLTVKLTGEFGMYTPKSDKYCVDGYCDDNNASLTQMGGALDVSGTFGSMEAGIASAYGMETGTTIDDADLADTALMAIFGWMKMAVGEADTFGAAVGYQMKDVEDSTTDTGIETYVSYAHQLPVEGLKVTFAGSYAMASTDPEVGEGVDNSGFGVRCRFNYDF